jgi:AGZA family xanthine/uracil permease-like MFS transporter
MLKSFNANLKTEILAGLTTFIAMSYILVVNPLILGQTGMNAEALFIATALASAIMTLIMGLYANLPIALAPGMGLNAFFTYTLCLNKGIPWQGALGIVFYSGILFFLITVLGLRKKIISVLPTSIRIGLTVGIGLFITLIGLKNANIVVANPATLISLGNIFSTKILVIFFGIILSVLLKIKKVPGFLFISIIFITIVYFFLGEIKTPSTLLSSSFNLNETFFKLDLLYFWNHLSLCLPLLITLLFVDMFDNLGTLISVGTKAGLMDKNGEIKNMDQALRSDAFAAMIGAILGTSSVVSYIESATGVEQGGKTGMTAIVVAFCFILSLLFAPLFLMIPIAATTPALVFVGVSMIAEIREIDFDNILDLFPAFITMIMIPFSFSIAEGIAIGLAAHVLILSALNGFKFLRNRN